jgi:hypothetical protein
VEILILYYGTLKMNRYNEKAGRRGRRDVVMGEPHVKGSCLG